MTIKNHILADIDTKNNALECNIFINELMTIYNSEKKLNLKLPKMILKAKSTEVAEALINHLKFTQEHLTRLETFFKSINQPIKP